MISLTDFLKESYGHCVLLWVDDLRNPVDSQWQTFIKKAFNKHISDIVWVKNYDEFVEWIDKNGLPNLVSFDHDLGDTSDDEKSGYSCCKYLVAWCQNNDCDIPEYAIQSSNPAGAENIKCLMDNYHKFYNRTH